MHRLIAVLGICALCAVPALAWAQGETAPLRLRRVIINFEDEVIESGTEGPLLVMHTARRPARHPSTIKVRARFARRVLLSAHDL